MDMFGGFGISGPMDDDERDENIEEVMKLSPEDSLAVAIATLQALSHPIGKLVYPQWKEDMVVCLVRCVQMSKDMMLLGNLMRIAITASVVTARINKESAEKTGIPLDERDESELLSDPKQILETVMENLPEDSFFEEAVEYVKNKLRIRFNDSHKTVDEDGIKELRDLFNMPAAEEPNDETS